ncbi:polyphosphate polymerase domain-containing protein [Anoxynatronum buryatiense]|nr:polyphosphate polymerase domain-containing protein [Anoxynatronum buryatiense]
MNERFFNRHEFKYVISEETATQMLEAIEPHMKRDRHTNETAHYRISSLYFDTRENLFHDEYLRAEQFRQKLRLRVYNQPTLMDPCFFEIKKKFKGFVSKRRARLTLKSVYDWLADRITLQDLCEAFPLEAHVLREIGFLRQHYRLEPRVVIAYIRQAHVGIFDEDLRVTMDRQLTRRTTLLEPHLGCDPAHDDLYLPTGRVVLEVKSSGTIPLWLAGTLSRLSCRKQAFSKYSTSYSPPEVNDTAVESDRRHA